jgi:SpoIID/LytB domain protein
MRFLLVATVLLAGAVPGLESGDARQLPPPLPPPREPAPQVEADPLELVWGHRLHFAPGGVPLVTIRIAERRPEVRFQALADTRLLPRGAAPVRVPRGAWLRARAYDAQPAVLTHHVLVAELDHADRAGIDAARKIWTSRGLDVAERVIGGVYGIAGKVVDNRRTLLLAGGALSAADANALADRIQADHGARPALYAALVAPPSGRVEVTTEGGEVLASGDALVSVEGGGFALDADGGAVPRRYRGRLVVTIDSAGLLAAVDALPLEDLLRGLVPSEIPASSPREALKAQAVTARSYVLAQLGTRHLSDPYALCSEVHCQAYHGEAAETPSTDAAVSATAGEALFDRGGMLVDGVYSAVCGGHGEDNDAVWQNLPSATLRGLPDLAPAAARRWRGGLGSDARVEAFLDSKAPAWCAAGPKKRYRWTRSFSPAEVDAIGSELGAGPVERITVLRRGVSGRALALEVVGRTGRVVLEGELRIRRAFRNLESAMFLVSRSGERWVFRGGGWGHGVGMCQWGAVGRARAGQDYREILGAYFGRAEVATIY